MEEERKTIETEARLYIVEDITAESDSPVFEQPTDGAAKRAFNINTLDKLPPGVDKGEFALWYVGKRVGKQIESVSPQLLQRGEVIS